MIFFKPKTTNKMNKQERKNRVIARGEGSNHSHVITGDAIVTRNNNGEILIEVGNEGAVLRHILETSWMEGAEVHTKEHGDISLTELPNQVRQGDVLLEKVGERTYKYIAQQEYDPYNDVIQQVRD
jgi:hypothetical protein